MRSFRLPVWYLLPLIAVGAGAYWYGGIGGPSVATQPPTSTPVVHVVTMAPAAQQPVPPRQDQPAQAAPKVSEAQLRATQEAIDAQVRATQQAGETQARATQTAVAVAQATQQAQTALQARLEQNYKDMEDNATAGKWDAALRASDRIMKESPSYKDVAAKRNSYFDQIYERAKGAINDKKWKDGTCQ